MLSDVYKLSTFDPVLMQSSSHVHNMLLSLPRRSAVRIPVTVRYFSLLQIVQTSSGAHSASCSVGTVVLSRGVMLTTHLYLTPRLLPVYTFIACTATTLPLSSLRCLKVGRDSVVGIATRYGLDGPGIESRWGRGFPHQSRPVSFPGVKRPGRGVDHPPPSRPGLKKG
jgi:hypothetical protein